MTRDKRGQATFPPANKKIYLLFFCSGISGLIYETVWLRVLIRILGSTVYATSIVLAAFMAGMALGSYAFGRYCERKKNLLSFYAFLEIGIGFSALMLMGVWRMLGPLTQTVYVILGQQRWLLTVFQSCLMFFVLLVPTALMGGTLPVLSSYTHKYHVGFSQRLGTLYGLNTLGAAVGVLFSGLYAMGEFGETATVWLGVLINVCVALGALSLSRKDQKETVPTPEGSVGPAAENERISDYGATTRRLVFFATMISGFTAMAYEVVWTRILQIQVGTSIYAFSLMLANYLAGLALGSLWGGVFVARRKNLLSIFAVGQLFIAFAVVGGMYLFLWWTPWSFDFKVAEMFVKPFCLIFPVTLTFGFLFPLVSKSYVRDEGEVARGTGRIYAANTTGCILGSLACGFLLIRFLGTRNTLLFLAGMNAVLGLVFLWRDPAVATKKIFKISAWFIVIALAALGVRAPDPFIASMRKIVGIFYGPQARNTEIYFHKENVAATTTVVGIKDSARGKTLFINGVGVTSLRTETKLMAHLPLLLHPRPQNLLVICFGMGTTLRSAWIHSGVHCDTVDLVGDVYESMSYFHANGQDILRDARVRAYVDDGRNFLFLHPERYDVITMDPSPPIWSAGTVNLYTQDFFRLCKAHLKPNGIMCLWLMPCEYSEGTMIMKTFQTVFSNTYVFQGPEYPGVYLVGLPDEAALRLERFKQADGNPVLVADLNEWDHLVPKPSAILNLLILTPDQLAEFVKDVNVITDDKPYTEFPLWRKVFDETYYWVLDGNLIMTWRRLKFGHGQR